MQKDIYEKIINFLLGASWAVVLFGALIVFKTFFVLGFVIASFLTLIYIILSLFLILALDAFSVHKEKLKEMQKQTQILQDINSNINIKN
jgi:1,4-dihydroxy-2-naphthoate octaprenyltransferase